MRSVRLCALLMLGGALLASPAGAYERAVNAGSLFDRQDADAQLSRLRAGGVTTIRFDACWGTVEPLPGARDWRALDRRVEMLRSHDLRWLPVLSYTAPWAGAVFAAPPPALFAAFAGAVAQRYPEVRAYEVWNEPNLDSFWARPNPAAYGRLYALTRVAIHAADPGAEVVVGGLAPAGAAGFARRIPGRLDAIGLHPYWHYPREVRAAIAAVRRARPGLPVLLTEVGWSTAVETESYKTRALRWLRSARLPVQLVAPYAWDADGFGLADNDAGAAWLGEGR